MNNVKANVEGNKLSQSDPLDCISKDKSEYSKGNNADSTPEDAKTQRYTKKFIFHGST